MSYSKKPYRIVYNTINLSKLNSSVFVINDICIKELRLKKTIQPSKVSNSKWSRATRRTPNEAILIAQCTTSEASFLAVTLMAPITFYAHDEAMSTACVTRAQLGRRQTLYVLLQLAALVEV